MTHTKGPWTITGGNVNGLHSYEINHSDGELRSVVARTHDAWICSEHDGNAIENARLIAAAPDLLQALKDLTELLPTVRIPNIDDARAVERLLDRTAAAIKKAEGQS